MFAQVDRLAALRKIQINFSGEARRLCEAFPPLRSPRDRATSLRRPFPLAGALEVGGWALDPSDPNRAWLYQTCTEFGFYQASRLLSLLSGVCCVLETFVVQEQPLKSKRCFVLCCCVVEAVGFTWGGIQPAWASVLTSTPGRGSHSVFFFHFQFSAHR